MENDLLVLVIPTGAVGLAVPRMGEGLAGSVTLLLALLTFAVSLPSMRPR